MLFDPFEEKLDLPSCFVELCNRQRRQVEVVCNKHEPFLGVGIDQDDPSGWFRIGLGGLGGFQHDRLVAPESGRLVDEPRASATKASVLLGPDHEERLGLVHPIEAFVVQVTAVHYIEGAGFQEQDVQHVDIV